MSISWSRVAAEVGCIAQTQAAPGTELEHWYHCRRGHGTAPVHESMRNRQSILEIFRMDRYIFVILTATSTLHFPFECSLPLWTPIDAISRVHEVYPNL